MNIPEGEVRILKCKKCDKDVTVNAAYPITEVTCKDCWKLQKTNAS